MGVFTTEIASDHIISDNPVHQRLLKAYEVAKPHVKGDLLELGCGEGRGVNVLAPLARHFKAMDKIGSLVERLSAQYPLYEFRQGVFPPVPYGDESFDTIVSFQVIEHISDDHLFLREIKRLLRPGGIALLTTPNIKMTLSRNPWHIREYTHDRLEGIAGKYFEDVEMKGIAGNEAVMRYHERNRKSVERYTKFDVFDLEHRLPASLLKIPYDILNRMNRNSLRRHNSSLVQGIGVDDYYENDKNEKNLDLLLILKKTH